jgi:hypothetical protein
LCVLLCVSVCLLQVDRLCAMDDFKELLPWLDGKARGSHLESTPPPSLAQNMRSILNAYQVRGIHCMLGVSAPPCRHAVCLNPFRARHTCTCPWTRQHVSSSHATRLPKHAHSLTCVRVCLCAPFLQVILVSASLRPNSLQTAKAWTDTNPINVCSKAPADATPAARAAAAAAEAGQGTAKQTAWGQMLPDTISHQVSTGRGRGHAKVVQGLRVEEQ